MTAVPPYDNLHSDLNGNPSFSWMVVNNSEVIWSENGKRLFCDDETCLYASKHSKQLGSFEDNCFPAFEKPPLGSLNIELYSCFNQIIYKILKQDIKIF